MSFHLVTHWPWLFAKVAKFPMCERKVIDLLFFVSFIFIYFIFNYFLISINNQGKQDKMLRKRHFATEWLQNNCVINFFTCK